MAELNNSMLLQYRLMTLQGIVTLTDENHDVNLWHDQFQSWCPIQKITASQDIYNWCLIKEQGMDATAIRDLEYTNADGTTVYPSLEKMKDTLLKTYKLKKDPEDIINELKSLKISYQDNVKEFNKKYRSVRDSPYSNFSNIKMNKREITIIALVQTMQTLIIIQP
ncbi:hypothetical protein BCR36DRAFT_292873 [Piromyces finnis]|uniref:Uncharacterized protein n=1 Tax=Piromyces finnis TaxID=1754191 RepID=A0A1Y1V6X4_9FUNG|nr:hypothetical protein BCR36DRAFT_292873 [Piromyces finnis]|eukprot:ORX48722.1 hypothetical protein BCR36DRAFT_292873 [Piromyces finnis]